MTDRAERRRQQIIRTRIDEADQQQRPNVSPAPITEADQCPAIFGQHLHDYTMRGTDGVYRCWFCCGRKPS